MSESFFQFRDPWYFLLLLPVFLFPVLPKKRKGNLSLYFSSLNFFTGLKRSWRQRFIFVPMLLRCLALFLLVTGLARPQWGNRTTEILSEGIDILLTIDTSGSMKALDFKLEGKQVNRLEVVKKVVDRFISHRSHDRMGMIIFGERAYTQCPLTLDTDTLRLFLDWIHIGIAGDGTAIGNALAVSVKRLLKEKTKSRVIILLTDGRNNAGEISPLLAAQMARTSGIKVYTIGVGSAGPVPYPEETPFGPRIIYANLDIDEATLQEIARETGGRYFRATGTEELKEIYEEIDREEKTDVTLKNFEEANELFPWLVFGGVLFLVLEILLEQTIFLRIP